MSFDFITFTAGKLRHARERRTPKYTAPTTIHANPASFACHRRLDQIYRQTAAPINGLRRHTATNPSNELVHYRGGTEIRRAGAYVRRAAGSGAGRAHFLSASARPV